MEPSGTSPTPILDLIEALPSKQAVGDLKWWHSLSVVLAFVLGIPGLAFIGGMNPAVVKSLERLAHPIENFFDSFDSYGPFFSMLVFLAVFFAVALAAIALHEFGHLLVGRLYGFRFKTLVVGPFSATLEHGKMQFHIRKWSSLDGFANIEIRTVRRLRRNLVAFAVAGPATSLASGLVSILILNAKVFDGLPIQLLATLKMFVAWSFLLFATSIVPHCGKNGVFSDGARLQMLHFSKLPMRRWLSTIGLGAQLSHGVRPRLWPHTWIEAATRIADHSVDALIGSWFAYCWANDREDEVCAAKHLESCLQRAEIGDGPLREIMSLEASVFHAWFKRDAEKAREWKSRVQHLNKLPPILRIRAEVALLWVRDRPDEAAASWESGLALIRAMLDTPTRSSWEESWLEWRRQMDARKASGVGS